MRLPGVVRTAQGEITLCNYSRKYLGLKKKKRNLKKKKTQARLRHGHERRKTGEKTEWERERESDYFVHGGGGG